jgi:hypothetical protein
MAVQVIFLPCARRDGGRTECRKATPSLRAGLPSTFSPRRDARELVDPTARRLILLVSDTVAPAFRDGRVMCLLSLWGERSPTAVLHVLPQRL